MLYRLETTLLNDETWIYCLSGPVALALRVSVPSEDTVVTVAPSNLNSQPLTKVRPGGMYSGVAAQL